MPCGTCCLVHTYECNRQFEMCKRCIYTSCFTQYACRPVLYVYQQIACGSDHTLAVSQDGLLGCPATQPHSKDLDPQLSIIKDEDGADVLFSKVWHLCWFLHSHMWHLLGGHSLQACHRISGLWHLLRQCDLQCNCPLQFAPVGLVQYYGVYLQLLCYVHAYLCCCVANAWSCHGRALRLCQAGFAQTTACHWWSGQAVIEGVGKFACMLACRWRL